MKTHTAEDLLAMADALEKNASRRGYSGVEDREKAMKMREQAAAMTPSTPNQNAAREGFLCAAAPDMLEALESIATHFHKPTEDGRPWPWDATIIFTTAQCEAIRAVIAKAQGKPHLTLPPKTQFSASRIRTV